MRRLTKTLLAAGATAAMVVGLGSAAQALPGGPDVDPDTITIGTTPASARGVAAPTPPTVGSCHLLTGAESWQTSDAKAPVPCKSKHTTLTVAVHQFDVAPDWDDVPSYISAVSRACGKGFWNRLPDKRAVAKTMYSGIWFMPTEAERAAGAKWIRCDLVLPNGKTKKSLNPLPPNSKLLSKKYRMRYTVCVAPDLDYVACNFKHVNRATHAFKHSGSKYPGRKVLKKWTVKKCNPHMGRNYRYSVPSKASWKAGFHYSICYKQTRK